MIRASIKIVQGIVKAIPKGKTLSKVATIPIKLSEETASLFPFLQGQPAKKAFDIITTTKSQTTLLGNIFKKYDKTLANKTSEEITSFFSNNKQMEELFTCYKKGGDDLIFTKLMKTTGDSITQNGIDKTLASKSKSLNDIKAYWRNIFQNKSTANSQQNLLDKLYQKASFGKSAGAMKRANEGGMELDLLDLDTNIASKIDAHGIAKTSLKEQLASLDNLLKNGIDKNRHFYSAPLALSKDAASAGCALGTGGGCAYRDGAFIITSGLNKSLTKDSIENVIVNHCFYNIVDDLQKAYPNVKFIKSSDAADYFNNLV